MDPDDPFHIVLEVTAPEFDLYAWMGDISSEVEEVADIDAYVEDETTRRRQPLSIVSSLGWDEAARTNLTCPRT